MKKSVKQSKIWSLYVLECVGGSLYTGIALDPQRRLEQHRKGLGAAYTRIHKPLRLRYCTKVGSHSVALKQEYLFKQLSRREKLEFLAGLKPRGGSWRSKKIVSTSALRAGPIATG